MHWLKDPETNKYNFHSGLEDIPRVADFAFDRLGGFVPSSQDKVRILPLYISTLFRNGCLQALLSLAKAKKCKYAGSTSSLTGILTQIYLLLSEEKLLNTSILSADFEGAVSALRQT